MSPLAVSSIKIWTKGSPILIAQHSELLSEMLKATERNIYFNHPPLYVLLFFFLLWGLAQSNARPQFMTHPQFMSYSW